MYANSRDWSTFQQHHSDCPIANLKYHQVDQPFPSKPWLGFQPTAVQARIILLMHWPTALQIGKFNNHVLWYNFTIITLIYKLCPLPFVIISTSSSCNSHSVKRPDKTYSYSGSCQKRDIRLHLVFLQDISCCAVQPLLCKCTNHIRPKMLK
jgi:hypothetical protein